MKVRIVMIGECPSCGKEHQREFPIDAAVCICRNPDPMLVPLSPTLILPNAIFKKFAKIAELAGVDVERLISELLLEAAKEKLEKLKKSYEDFQLKVSI